MEKDNLVAQGLSGCVSDRLLEQSDEYQMWVCNHCGLPAIVDKDNIRKECKICQTSDVTKIKIPYGTKLFIQELLGMGIALRIMVPQSKPKMIITS
jgi:DNA-directed RNA polymerase beta subunit